MKYYRIYRVDWSNQIKAAFDIVCATDDEALDIARPVTGPEPIAEVWQAARLVGRVHKDCRGGVATAGRAVLAEPR